MRPWDIVIPTRPMLFNNIIAVTNYDDALALFSQWYNPNETMTVYGIKGTTANILMSAYDAAEFFKETE